MSTELSPPRPASPSGAIDEQQPQEPTHPPFEPLFTLLSNTTTNTTSHPRVHYIFSDDEPSILPPSRSVLVDLEETNDNGWGVKSASSLSGDFAVTDAKLEGEGMLRVECVQREGVPVLGSKDGLGRSREGRDSAREDVEGLVDDFKRRMGVLKRVVEQGERSVGHLRPAEEQSELEQHQPQQDECVSPSAETRKAQGS